MYVRIPCCDNVYTVKNAIHISHWSLVTKLLSTTSLLATRFINVKTMNEGSSKSFRECCKIKTNKMK